MWTYSLPDGSTAADLREATNAALQMVATEFPVVLVGAAVDAGKVSLLVTVNPIGQKRRPERPRHPGRGAARPSTVAAGARPTPRRAVGSKPEGVEAALLAAREYLAARA